MAFKRNQVIEAIEEALLEGGNRPAQVATRLKRLLHADRLLKRNPRSKSPEQSTFAFFSGGLSGTGNEYLYSPFEAFALFLGIRLLESGFPQRVAVRMLRLFRAEFEKTFGADWDLQVPNHGRRWYLARLAPADMSSNIGSIGLCRGEDAVASYLRKAMDGQIMTVIELTRPILRFKAAIERTKPAKRGRR
jgi:hypothetical protein